MKFFDPYSEVHVTRNCLPHWQQPGAAYFLTFRLADSLPETLLAGWREEKGAWLKRHPKPHSAEDEAEFHRLFSTRIDHWLDAGHGGCLLDDTLIQDHVEDAFRHFNGDRYELLSWVVMPNHLHVCLVLNPVWRLEKIVFTWKRRMAGAINCARGTTGTIWMPDYFDRLIRDRAHFENVIRYIRRNPEKARLPSERFRLWEGELARSIVWLSR